jgi:hypothetical protein
MGQGCSLNPVDEQWFYERKTGGAVAKSPRLEVYIEIRKLCIIKK